MPNARPELGSSSLAISQAVISFTAFLPNFVEVGKSDKAEIENEVRLGEAAAVTTALAVGALLSWLNAFYVPFFVAAIMSFVLVAMYEAAMRKDV